MHSGRLARGESAMNDDPISLTPPPEGYAEWPANLTGCIHSAQQRAPLAVNRKIALLHKLGSLETRRWYAAQAMQ